MISAVLNRETFEDCECTAVINATRYMYMSSFVSP